MCRSYVDLLYIALNRRPAIWTPMPWTARTEKHVFESPSEDILWWHTVTYQDNLLLRAKGVVLGCIASTCASSLSTFRRGPWRSCDASFWRWFKMWLQVEQTTTWHHLHRQKAPLQEFRQISRFRNFIIFNYPFFFWNNLPLRLELLEVWFWLLKASIGGIWVWTRQWLSPSVLLWKPGWQLATSFSLVLSALRWCLNIRRFRSWSHTWPC